MRPDLIDPTDERPGSCNDCMYFQHYRGTSNGVCRRHPPANNAWINIGNDEYCWEFEKRGSGKNPAAVKKQNGRFDTLEG